MSDLTERLRECANGMRSFKTELGDYGICDEAAARIEALEAELAAIADCRESVPFGENPLDFCIDRARQALATTGGAE